nr:tRNA lysidine(34) synthetase TilS [Anaerolineae bacterium]
MLFPFNQGDPVVVGVSGGPDSLTLLHLFVRVRDSLGICPHVVHLDHQIRGADSARDAQAVDEIAREWDVPCHIEQMNVPELAAQRHLSLEETARQARYTTFGKQAVRIGAKVIAVGHNADDQSETILMRLLRGAGLVGLRGMLPVSPLSAYHLLEPLGARIDLVRPLLDIPRTDIEAYCIAHNLKPRFDSTNLDTTYLRNRIRHEVFPILETVNPNVRVNLTQTASVLAAHYDVIREKIDLTCEMIVRAKTPELVAFDIEAWRQLPLALQRATLRRAARHLHKAQQDISFQHIEDAKDVAMYGQTGNRATLPGGLEVHVDYELLKISMVGHLPDPPDWPLLEVDESIPIHDLGEVSLPGSEWLFSLQVYDGPRSGSLWESVLADPWSNPLNASVLTCPLTLRTRRPGDRFFPLGLGGTQKISNFMINEKIPAVWRDYIPLLEAGGQIVWLAGWRLDERFAVREDTQEVWLASFTRSGNE